ncbi:DUF4390 domain-containing protein [Corticimicrobacter populi]|nr:DUF4390 domain-containing protein [Corticimicrobacter populi]
MVRSVCAGFVWLVLLLVATPGWTSSEPAVERARLYLADGYWQLDADFDFSLNPQLRQAAERGLPLPFTIELQVTRQRWWWLDRSVIDASRTWRITYNALTRQWRAGAGELNLPVASLEQALALVRHVRHWTVAPDDALDPTLTYDARVRLRLDTSYMSRPLQIDALNSNAWGLETPWQTVEIGMEGLDQEGGR